jgi:hypothetical protein
MGVCEGMRGSSDLREGARLESLAASLATRGQPRSSER